MITKRFSKFVIIFFVTIISIVFGALLLIQKFAKQSQQPQPAQNQPIIAEKQIPQPRTSVS